MKQLEFLLVVALSLPAVALAAAPTTAPASVEAGLVATGAPALVAAAALGDLARVKQLVDEGGADVNELVDLPGGARTPIMAAAEAGRAEVVSFLLDCGVLLNAFDNVSDRDGHDAEHLARAAGHAAVADLLAERRAAWERRDEAILKRLLQGVPELLREGPRRVMYVERAPDPEGEDRLAREFFGVYVGEDLGDHTVRTDTFLVHRELVEVKAWDALEGRALTLAEWRAQRRR